MEDLALSFRHALNARDVYSASANKYQLTDGRFREIIAVDGEGRLDAQVAKAL